MPFQAKFQCHLSIGDTPDTVILVAQYDAENLKALEAWCQEQREGREHLPLLLIADAPLSDWLSLVPLQPCDFSRFDVADIETRLHLLAQKKVPDAKHLFMSLFQKHAAAMFLVDAHEGLIRSFNPAAIRFYGFHPEKLQSLSIFDLNQAPQKNVLSALGQARKGLKNHFFFKHKLGNGEIRDVEIHTTPFVLDGRDLLFTVIRDITQHKATKRALEDSEMRYRQMVETAEEGIIILDEDYTVSFANQKMLQLLEADQHQDILGKPFSDFLVSRAMNYYEKQVERLRQGITQTQDICLRTCSAKELWVSASTSLRFDASGTYKGLMSFLTDITPRKTWEKEMETALLERETLLRELNHRVKNNFQTMMSLLSLQSRKTTPGSAERRLLTAAQSRLFTLALIHEQAYDNAGVRALHFQPFIRLLIRETSARYKGANVNVNVNVNAESLPLDIDNAILCSLILNELLKNCFEHAFAATENPVIDVDVSRSEQGIVLAVQDNGSGFETSSSVHREQLGLSLVEHWAKQSGGSLRFTTLHPGVRCTFESPLRPEP